MLQWLCSLERLKYVDTTEGQHVIELLNQNRGPMVTWGVVGVGDWPIVGWMNILYILGIVVEGHCKEVVQKSEMDFLLGLFVWPSQLERLTKQMREAEQRLKAIPQFCFPDAKDWSPVSEYNRYQSIFV